MKRTIIPEDRKRIEHKNISLNIKEGENSLKVEVELEIKKDDYPENAEIILEAYNRINIERIKLGKVQDYKGDKQSFDLPFEIPSRAKINFRLKVIDPNDYKLLGYAEKLKEGKYTESLLKLDTSNVDVKNIFQIDFENDQHPIVDLNPNLKSCADKLKPIIAEMALKEILMYLLFVDDNEFRENKWFKFSNNLVEYQNNNGDEDKNNEDKLNWINEVLNKFSEHKVINAIKKEFEMIKLQKLTQEAEKLFQEKCKNHETNFNLEEFKTADISSEISIDENKIFKNKFELGEYLYEKLKDIQVDNAIWHFLTIVYHKHLLKNNKIGEVDRFFINKEKSFYPFTHLLKPIFDLYSSYEKDSNLIKFLLLSSINESSGVFLEVIKRQEIMKNKSFIEVAKTIFYNEDKQKNKKGSIKGILRLIALFKQYERTFDLYSMPSEKILEKLIRNKKEFNKFFEKKV